MDYEPQVISRKDFCIRNKISDCTFFKLQREGRGPRVMHVGRTIRITLEAERDWRAAREQPSDAEARLLKREAEARQRRARKAAAASVAGAEHISKHPDRRKRATVGA
jgi:hypothetical protein